MAQALACITGEQKTATLAGSRSVRPCTMLGCQLRSADHGSHGHKRIEETMLYVHVAESHRRETRRRCWWRPRPRPIRTGRSLAMLAARGSQVAADPTPETKRVRLFHVVARREQSRSLDELQVRATRWQRVRHGLVRVA
jgi:hypothetical protein